MERRRFTREFKLEAVKLIKERGVGYVQAARDLGVHQSAGAAGDRAAQARGDQAEGGAGYPKKAAAYLAKEST